LKLFATLPILFSVTFYTLFGVKPHLNMHKKVFFTLPCHERTERNEKKFETNWMQKTVFEVNVTIFMVAFVYNVGFDWNQLKKKNVFHD